MNPWTRCKKPWSPICPWTYNATMIGALRVYARSGQALVVAPFTLAGANTPASATATVAEWNRTHGRHPVYAKGQNLPLDAVRGTVTDKTVRKRLPVVAS